ncbi:glycosyltransferase [Scopulibacillus cellulosilyticus]|uniref:Glycosyltransferase n=1 Tax=Scopulibacillus cellulosilyticus TaxID=2665665 RepID=A0ABW2PRV7_9BACL
MIYQIYFLMNKIEMVRGGMTKALFNRANLLSDNFKQIHILSFNFNPDYDLIRQELYRLGKIKGNVIIHNLYEFLANKTKSPFNVPIINHPIEENGLVAHKDKDPKKNAYRLYKDGLYIKYKKYNEDNKLEFIDYFNENRYRTRRETFDSAGQLRQILYMDYVSNKPRQSLYFDEDGHCFLSVWFDHKTGDFKRINWFNQNGDLNHVFYSETELKRYWLEKLTEHDSHPVLLSDSRSTDKWAAAVQNPNAAKMLVIHSNHLKKPYHYGSPLAERNRSALEMMDQFDAVIFLTENQKKDIERQFGPRSIYHVIPHNASKVNLDREIERDPLTAVTLARYVKNKNLDHMIRVFRKVVDQIPKAKLELWGFGPEEESLRNLIKQLNLESNVFLKGFTLNPNEVYERAAFSLITSRTEAFGLVITESMAAGAPVISYDIKYGPSDIITNGVDGILVKPNDSTALSKAIIDLFTNKIKQQAMSLEARKIVEKFSDKKFVQQWIDVFEKATEQKRHRIKLNQPICALKNLEWVDFKRGKIKLDGEAVFEKGDNEIKSCLQLSLYIRQRDKLADTYVPVEFEWKDNRTVSFSGQFLIDDIVNDYSLGKVFDVYVSCSARNTHEFVRLGKGKEKRAPVLSKAHYKKVSPYYTEYGNLSFKVQEPEKETGLEASTKQEFKGKLAGVVSLLKDKLSTSS